MLNFLEDHSYLSDLSGSMLFHQHPARRTVFFREYYHPGNKFGIKKNYFLSFPDMLFGVDYQKNHENSFTPTVLKAAFTDPSKSKIYRHLLPNSFYDFSMCLELEEEDEKTAELACRVAVNNFWTSAFDFFENNQLMANFAAAQIPCDNFYDVYPKFLLEWELQTKADQNWIPDLIPQLQVDWDGDLRVTLMNYFACNQNQV